MKNTLGLLATVALLAGLACPVAVSAAEPASSPAPRPAAPAPRPAAPAPRPATVSGDMLRQMGLAGMQPVSDEAGDQIRGKGLSFYSANLTTVTGVVFGQVFVFQKTNVYSSSGTTYSFSSFSSVGF